MEKLCLKWNDFQTNVAKSFGVLREEKNLFDVTLVSDEGDHVSAHRLVLSACSEFLVTQFKQKIFRKYRRTPSFIYTDVSSIFH